MGENERVTKRGREIEKERERDIYTIHKFQYKKVCEEIREDG